MAIFGCPGEERRERKGEGEERTLGVQLEHLKTLGVQGRRG
jgi:hypothetical protein